MDENRIVLRKIPIDMVIGLLESLFEQGYDYFDIEGSTGDEQDFIKIAIKAEYFSEEMEEENEEDNVPKKLSEDDLDKLL